MASRSTSPRRKSTVSAKKVIDAIKANNCQALQTWLSNHSLDVNEPIVYDWTPLHWTPLHWAALCGREGVVMMLIEHEADVNAADKYGLTPLHTAALRGREGVVEKLIEHEADVNAADKYGWTPLHWAAARGHEGVVVKLIEHEADVNAADKDGRTALDMCSGDRGEKIKAILKKHLDQKQRKQCLAETPAAELAQAAVDAHCSAAGVGLPPDCSEVNIRLGLGKDNLPPELLGVNPELPSQNNIPGEASKASCVPFYDPGTESPYAHFHASVSKASGSVCKIIWSNGKSGSGFLVGRNKMITALHVVVEQPPITEAEEQERRQNRKAFFNFDRPNEEIYNDDHKHLYGEFTENPVLVQIPDLDIAILQLLGFHYKEPCAENRPTPQPLQQFKMITEHVKTIDVSGHPDGQAKRVCHCRIKQFPGDTKQQLRQWSYQTLGEDIYTNLDNPSLIWYDASEDFEEGSSGCPGFIHSRKQEACVTVVHTSGYRPGRRCLPGTVIPAECQFEEGVRIEAVWHFLYYEGYRDMCNEIFPLGPPL